MTGINSEVDAPSAIQDSRLLPLLQTGLLLAGEMSVEAILERIVESAALVTGARYAALGVVDQSGRALEQLVATGVEDETRRRIGSEPRGRGVLGTLIRDPRPLRLRKISEDPGSVGFPPGHPPMTTFLGVPVTINGAIYGILYLADKEDGTEFTDEDEELVGILARQAGLAVVNTRLCRAGRVWADQLEIIGDLTDSLLADTRGDHLSELIVAQFRSFVDAEGSVMGAFDAGGGYRIVAAEGKGADSMLAMSPPLPARYLRILEGGAAVRVDSLMDDPDVDPRVVRTAGVRSTLLAPLIVGGTLMGILAAFDRVRGPRFTDADQRAAEVFAHRAAAILQLSQRVRRESVESILAAQEKERRRIGLELHDQTGQELTGALLGLKRLDALLEDNSEARQEVASLRGLIADSLRGVRSISSMLAPPALGDGGLFAALEHLAHLLGERSGVAIRLITVIEEEDIPSSQVGALYRIAQESLTNVVRHAGATEATIVVERTGPGRAALVISDNGKGIDTDVEFGVGLSGIRERANLIGGVLSVQPRPVGGTRVTVEVPLQ